MGKIIFGNEKVVIIKKILGNLDNPSVSLREIQSNDLVELETLLDRPYEPMKKKLQREP